MADSQNSPKYIDTPYLRIKDNCLEMANVCIQMSNVSLFSTSDLETQKFPVWSAVLIVCGLIAFYINILAGAALTVLGGLWIYVWYKEVKKLRMQKKLTIYTNSGHIFSVVFADKKFLDHVLKVVRSCLLHPDDSKIISINVQECSLSGNASVVQNLNEMENLGEHEEMYDMNGVISKYENAG